MAAIGPGDRYKYRITGHGGVAVPDKADPFARRTETPPYTASIVEDEPSYAWGDAGWMRDRPTRNSGTAPWTIYELHAGSLCPRGVGGLALPHLSRAGASGRGPRRAPRLHACRAHADHGAPVLRLVGLPGDELFRTHRPLRHARRPALLRRPPAPARHRRDLRLGALPLPGRRPRAPPFRRQPDLRVPGPADGLPPGMDELHLRLRPAGGALLPDLVGIVLAPRIPRRRAAGGRRGIDAVPRLLAPAGRVGSQPVRRAGASAGGGLPASAEHRGVPGLSRRADDRRGVDRLAGASRARSISAASASG